jgi:hypothetical protein
MHHQGPGFVHRQITCPVDDEFLGSRVEIALTERRRIDRVEELSQLCDADFYDLAALREIVSSGRPRLRRHLSSRKRMVRSVDNTGIPLGGSLSSCKRWQKRRDGDARLESVSRQRGQSISTEKRHFILKYHATAEMRPISLYRN